jgi:hypothetical protein
MRNYLRRHLTTPAVIAVAAALLSANLAGAPAAQAAAGAPHGSEATPPPITCHPRITSPIRDRDGMVVTRGAIGCLGGTPRNIIVIVELHKPKGSPNPVTQWVAVSNSRGASVEAFWSCVPGKYHGVMRAAVQRGPGYVPETEHFGPLTSPVVDIQC